MPGTLQTGSQDVLSLVLQLLTQTLLSVKKLVRKTKKVDVEKLVMTCHFGI